MMHFLKRVFAFAFAFACLDSKPPLSKLNLIASKEHLISWALQFFFNLPCYLSFIYLFIMIFLLCV